MKSVVVTSLFAFLLLSPVFMSGTLRVSTTAERNAAITIDEALTKESAVLYDSLRLDEFGLNEKAFQYAWRGYQYLLEKGKLANADYLSICDFSQSSRNKRLYIIDLAGMTIFKNTYVAHGRNSGGEFAKYFSNDPKSHKSSLGFYVTGKTYVGQHGLSLNIDGIEKGINDKAMYRRIVLHGSDYVGDDFLGANPFSGRSYGCPAVPACETDTIVNTIKEGSCLFIYYPSGNYLKRSKILNG